MMDIGACYGTKFDTQSLIKAQNNRDMSLIKMESAEACFPGVSKSFYSDFLCVKFKECSSNFAKSENRFQAIGATESHDTTPPKFTIPNGWNNADGAESELISLNRASSRELLRSDFALWAYRAVNIVFLAFVTFAFVLSAAGSGASLVEKDNDRPSLADLEISAGVVLVVNALGFLSYNASIRTLR
jgi:hypothetical protein